MSSSNVSNFYCHTCQHRFYAGNTEIANCPLCNGEFIEIIHSEEPGFRSTGEVQPTPPSSLQETPSTYSLRPIATFAIASPPSAVIRITLPMSSLNSTTPLSTTTEENSSHATASTSGGLPGFVQSILGIFSPSTGRGNGSTRRRVTRDQEQPHEGTPSTSRPRLTPSTTSFNAIPSAIAATFSTTLSEDDLSSPDRLQQFLISLFTQISNTMPTASSSGNSDSSATQQSSSPRQVEENSTTDSLTETSDNDTSSTHNSTSNFSETSANSQPNTPGDMIRLLLQQVLTGPLAMQWVRIPAIPDLLGDYVFGDRAFDDIISELMEQAAGQRAPPPANQSDIDALERVSYIPDKMVSLECSICREILSEGVSCIILGCKHVYHEQCIVPWLQLNGTCPICRTPTNTTQPDHQTNTEGAEE